MKTRKSKSSGFSSILSALIIIMMVTLTVGFLFYRTEGLTQGLKMFYVSYKGDNIVSDRENFTIILDKDYKIDIHNEIHQLFQIDGGYMVKVVPNMTSETNFSYMVNGEEKIFQDIESLTNQFRIDIHEDYFIFRAKGNMSDILKDYHKTNDISGCPDIINTQIPYFKLVITSKNNGETINIKFNIIRKGV